MNDMEISLRNSRTSEIEFFYQEFKRGKVLKVNTFLLLVSCAYKFAGCNASRARFSFTTFTPGSPKTPKKRPSVF